MENKQTSARTKNWGGRLTYNQDAHTYEGKTFSIARVFFPTDPVAWEKLQRSLKVHMDPEDFKRTPGTLPFSFQPGEPGCIAVQVIDFRGNEVVRVMSLITPG